MTSVREWRFCGALLVTALALSLALWGCEAGSNDAGDTSSEPEADASDSPPLGCVPCDTDEGCGDGSLFVARIAPWPEGGLQLTLALRDRVDDEAPEVHLTVDDEAVAVHAERFPEGPGITGVLLVPHPDEATHTARVSAATELVEGLPEGERVAAWLGARDLPLLADLSSQRGHVLQRLGEVPSGTPADFDDDDIEGLLDDLGDVETKWSHVLRNLVVIGADPVEVASDLPQRVELLWLPDAAEGPQRVLEHIGSRSATTWRVGACAEVEHDAPVTLRAGGLRCDFEAPKPIAHMASVACDAAAAARDDYPYGEDIHFTFTDTQRAVYDQYYEERIRDDFALSVSIGDSEPMPGEANLRGSSSMGCARKSYSVNLDGGAARRLAPGAASDEFYLLSMCLDERYFNQAFADRLLQPMDLFPLDFRFVRLFIDGENRGVYLLLEKVKDTLLDEHLQVETVIRRRYDAAGREEEVEYPDDDDGMLQASERYRALAALIESTPADGLLEALESRLDIDNYLRWLAVSSFLHNGDYVDEAYFYASEEAQDYGTAWYFRHMGWDPDDLFSECHGDGQYAIEDAYGLLYCAEANLDHALPASPTVYARYVDILERLLVEELPPAHLAATMDAIRDELWAVLDDDITAAAMVELTSVNPAARDVEEARADIQAHMDEMLENAETRRAELLEGIARYRAR